jgi:hypothetical protein
MATDLKQIVRMFNDCIEAIRNETHDNLEEVAVQWLKGARYQVMRSIEAGCVLIHLLLASSCQIQLY